MPRRAYSVRYRVTISMDYQPGEFECEVLAKSKETAILMVGREMSNQNIPITEGAKVLLVQILGDY